MFKALSVYNIKERFQINNLKLGFKNLEKSNVKSKYVERKKKSEINETENRQTKNITKPKLFLWKAKCPIETGYEKGRMNTNDQHEEWRQRPSTENYGH